MGLSSSSEQDDVGAAGGRYNSRYDGHAFAVRSSRRRESVGGAVAGERHGQDPAAPAPGRRDAAGRRVPDHPRRVDARRECADEPRDVRQHLDGAAGREADVGVLRQEHDRQGRVSADGGARAALRQHPQPSLAFARLRRGDRLLDDRFQRGRDARRSGAETALAAPAGRRGQARRQAEHRHGHQRPGLLGEARELLGRGDAAGSDGGRPPSPERRGGGEAVRREHDRRRSRARLDVRRLVRAGQGDLRRSRRPAGEDRARHPGPRRRRVGSVRRAVHRPGAGVGLPAAACRLDQRVGPQVRARLPRRRLGCVARRGRTARRPDLLGQLPRRQHADLRPELLAPWRPGRRAVLQLPAARVRGLRGGAGLCARRRHDPVVADRRAWPLRAAHARRRAARVRVHARRRDRQLLRLRRLELAARARLAAARVHVPEEPEDLAALRVVVKRGFSHDMANLLVEDIKRQLPKLQKQPEPVHQTAATGFHH